MTPSLAIALAALGVSFLTALFFFLHRRSVHARFHAITQILEQVVSHKREDDKILRAIDGLDSDTKEGIAYLGGRMRNVALIMQDHDDRISNNEKMTGATVKRPKMPKFSSPPIPQWLPPDSIVPDVELAEEGRPSEAPGKTVGGKR